MIPMWYPEPLTWADMAYIAAATDYAGQVEAATWTDSWLPEADRRAWRS